MAPYLTLATLKPLSIMPSADVDRLETLEPGFIAAQLEVVSAWIDARLRKRYAVPFVEPAPIAVRGWLAAIVTEAMYLRRGVDPDDRQWEKIEKRSTDAQTEVNEAADGENARIDLPLRADTTATGISKGGPLAYSEQSPYVGFSRQARTAREEDRNGRGTGG